mgnify:CR=1 FL=1
MSGIGIWLPLILVMVLLAFRIPVSMAFLRHVRLQLIEHVVE